MEVLFLGANPYGDQAYKWLCKQDNAEVLGIITEKEQLSLIRRLEPELIISGGFRHIVPEEILNIPEKGCINLHHSYLPYNRGSHPDIWSIIEDNPAGVSIHYMTPEIDEGTIIARKYVATYADDTGRDIYDRLVREQVNIFKQVWPDIVDGSLDLISQAPEEGSFHYAKELEEYCEIDLENEVITGDLIDRVRALTFPPYKNAYFETEGQKYYLELNITPESELEEMNSHHWNIP